MKIDYNFKTIERTLHKYIFYFEGVMHAWKNEEQRGKPHYCSYTINLFNFNHIYILNVKDKVSKCD